jgi:uncharacterized membrane protein
MDNTIMFGIAIIFLLSAMVYVTLKKRNGNPEENKELVSYKKQLERLEEQFRNNEISEDTYELLRRNLEEQHQITIIQTNRMNLK